MGYNPRNILRNRFSIAILIFLVFILTSHLSVYLLSQKQQKISEIVNIAGRQRMLAQKVGTTSLLIHHNWESHDPTEHVENLRESYHLLESHHSRLSNNMDMIQLDEETSIKLNELFSLISPSYSTVVSSSRIITEIHRKQGFSKENIDVVIENINLIVGNLDSFIKHMDRIVRSYSDYGEFRVRQLIHIELVLLVLSLLVISSIAVFIFLPAYRLIGSQWELMNNNAKEIEDKMNLAEALATKAEDASKFKSKFLLGISEQFRWSAKSILATANDLLKEDLSTDGKKLVMASKNSGESILSLADDIVDASDVDSAGIEIDEASIDLEKIISSVVEKMERRIGEKKIDLSYHVAKNVPLSLLGDERRIRQMLSNLVDNSLKYTNSGKIVVSCYVDETLNDSCCVRLSVYDTGIGISEDEVLILFNKLPSVSFSGVQNADDTGLGLVISQKLAKLMGGEIGVESELGVGSTFWVSMRLKVP